MISKPFPSTLLRTSNEKARITKTNQIIINLSQNQISYFIYIHFDVLYMQISFIYIVIHIIEKCIIKKQDYIQECFHTETEIDVKFSLRICYDTYFRGPLRNQALLSHTWYRPRESGPSSWLRCVGQVWRICGRFRKADCCKDQVVFR